MREERSGPAAARVEGVLSERGRAAPTAAARKSTARLHHQVEAAELVLADRVPAHGVELRLAGRVLLLCRPRTREVPRQERAGATRERKRERESRGGASAPSSVSSELMPPPMMTAFFTEFTCAEENETTRRWVSRAGVSAKGSAVGRGKRPSARAAAGARLELHAEPLRVVLLPRALERVAHSLGREGLQAADVPLLRVVERIVAARPTRRPPRWPEEK